MIWGVFCFGESLQALRLRVPALVVPVPRQRMEHRMEQGVVVLLPVLLGCR